VERTVKPPAGARALRVCAFAKINLGLEVRGARPDGYHELRTLFQTIDLHDDVVVRPRPRGLVVRCDHPAVPADERNLALRAALELQRHAGVERGAEIGITKRIPVGGGLGGGSSDAAAVLMALDRMWGVGLGPAGLHPLARRLGADVPFFLVGGTALGLARGDEVYALHRQVRCHTVVIDLRRPISTPAVFARVDQSLTPPENSNKIFRFVSSDLEGLGAVSILANDLERAALEEAPELADQVGRIRGILIREGAALASLSGSGSSFFGLYDDARRARGAQSALVAAGFIALRARTVSLDQYRGFWSRSLGGWRGAAGSNQSRSRHHGDHGRQGHSGRGRKAKGLRVDRV
jgi:4-diphosphocytidyl-2-C-methyl-D-erythritol kinase